MAQARKKIAPAAAKKTPAVGVTKKAAPKKPAAAPPPAAAAKGKRAYIRAADRTEADRKAWTANLKRQRWSNARAAMRVVEYCVHRIGRPLWPALKIDPEPFFAWAQSTVATLKERIETQPRALRWPKPAIDDVVAVRDKHVEIYLAPEMDITKKSLSNMVIVAVNATTCFCAVEAGERSLTIPFKPRHLRPQLATGDEPAPESGEVTGPSVDDDGGIPVGEDEEDDDDFEDEDDVEEDEEEES